jgi:hypothetical protein
MPRHNFADRLRRPRFVWTRRPKPDRGFRRRMDDTRILECALENILIY